MILVKSLHQPNTYSLVSVPGPYIIIIYTCSYCPVFQIQQENFPNTENLGRPSVLQKENVQAGITSQKFYLDV